MKLNREFLQAFVMAIVCVYVFYLVLLIGAVVFNY